MWSISKAIALLVALLSATPIYAAAAPDVCPIRQQQPLRYVDVFDGPAEDLAMLVPDRAGKRSGYWRLGYVYDAGRVVVIRCKYADKSTQDVTISKRVHRCDYKIDAKKTLRVSCK